MSVLIDLGLGLANGIANGIIAGKNMEMQKEANSQNLKLARESYEYQKQLNNLTMQREDNAVQRRAMDLEKAGFSKQLALGGAAGTANYSSGSLGQAQAASFDGDPLGAMFGMLESVERLKSVNLNNAIAQQQHAINGVRIKSELANIDKINAETERIQGDTKYTSEQQKREAIKRNYEQKNHEIPLDMLSMNYKGIPVFGLASQAGDNLNTLGNKIVNGISNGVEKVYNGIANFTKKARGKIGSLFKKKK